MEEDNDDGEVVRKIAGFTVPSDATRIKVLNEKGRVCWRKIEEFQPTDTVNLSASGDPVFMTGVIGRPFTKNVLSVAPASSKLVEDLLRFKRSQMRVDPVILAAESSSESPEVLNQVMLGIAEEAASLRFERAEAERQGGETSTISMRRVQALKAIGDAWIKRKEQIATKSIDLDSQSFQVIFEFISETFAKAMEESSVRPEMIDAVFASFSRMLDADWKKEAIARMTKE